MKRILIFLFILATTVAFAQDKKPRVGILQFTAKGLGDVEAEIIGEIFQSEIVSSGKFDVLDRANMDSILKEQEFQTTGCTESSCAVEIGKLLNMEYMFYGSAMKLGESYIISVGMVNIETSQITHSSRVQFSKIENANIEITKITESFIANLTTAIGNTKSVIHTTEVKQSSVVEKEVAKVETPITVIEKPKKVEEAKEKNPSVSKEDKNIPSVEEKADDKMRALDESISVSAKQEKSTAKVNDKYEEKAKDIEEKEDTVVENTSDIFSKKARGNKILKSVFIGSGLSIAIVGGAFHIQGIVNMNNTYDSYMALDSSDYDFSEWASVIDNAWNDYANSVNAAATKSTFGYISYGLGGVLLLTGIILPSIKSPVAIIPLIEINKTGVAISLNF